MLVSYLLFRRASWIAYLMGAICDMSFMFLQVTSGNIALNVPTISGPVLWALAVVITPFGMPRWQGPRELI